MQILSALSHPSPDLCARPQFLCSQKSIKLRLARFALRGNACNARWNCRINPGFWGRAYPPPPPRVTSRVWVGAGLGLALREGWVDTSPESGIDPDCEQPVPASVALLCGLLFAAHLHIKRFAVPFVSRIPLLQTEKMETKTYK